jgi:hypothetical protein
MRSRRTVGVGRKKPITRKKQRSTPTYLVPIVQKEKLSLWYEFWVRRPPTKRAVEANRNGSLGQTFPIVARNKAEAAKKAEAEHPGFVAIRESITGPLK